MFTSIEPGTIVLLRTGWSDRWPDRRAYLGDDTPGDASRLRFPSYGEDAVARMTDGLARRIHNGEFTLYRITQ